MGVRPRVAVLSLGGTIAMVETGQPGESGQPGPGLRPALEAADLVAAVPGLDQVVGWLNISLN